MAIGDAPGAGKSSLEKKLPADFGDKLKNLKGQKGRFTYGEVINEIMDMANGGEADGIREDFYQGWENEHFIELLRQLGESR